MGKTAIAIVNLPPRKMMGIASEGMLISAVHEEDGHEGLNLLMVDDRIPPAPSCTKEVIYYKIRVTTTFTRGPTKPDEAI